MIARRTRIKFCGMTRIEDIDAAVALGVDAIGLILVTESPRCLSLDRALALRRRIPPLVCCVALLRDPDPRWVGSVVEQLGPDLLQFHGSESPVDCRAAGRPYVKAIPMADPEVGLAMLGAHDAAAGFVFDSHAVDGIGGSGQVFDWRQIPQAARSRAILAGGLAPQNVGLAIRTVRPYAVDVASGIEAAPGRKSGQRMTDFAAAVRAADQIDADQGVEQ